MSDISVPVPTSSLHVCHGYRAINGANRHRGEVFDSSGARNMDILEEMGLATRTTDSIVTVDVEYDGEVRRFINDDYANAFIDWTLRMEAEAEAAAAEESSEEQPADTNEQTPAELGYDSMTKAQLSDLLTERGIEYTSSMTKGDLVNLLIEADTAPAGEGEQPPAE